MLQDFDHIVKVLQEIPKEGDMGKLSCPKCNKGEIHWWRAKTHNRHLRLHCTTEGCLVLIQ